MPIVQLQQPYATWRGRDSLSQGNVAYPTGGRMFARRFLTPADPDSPAQVAVRNRMTEASQAFSALTPAQISSWKTLSDGLPRTDPNGDSYLVGAKGIYVGVNINRLNDGQAVTSTAPDQFVIDGPSTVGQPTIAVGGATIDVIITYTSIPVSRIWLLELTPPLNQEALQPVDTDFRIAQFPFTGAFSAETTTPQTLTIQTADLPFVLAEDDRIGVRVKGMTDEYLGTPTGQTTAVWDVAQAV